ncbi:hypothetical protein IU402_08745 [Aerococcaceae bacterium zg-BR9]|uniref:hypothetical protein n=1 Tax=Aerococcaceae bacterium zg-1292 TaxID=2774330 RepID=UPI0040647664|nr:hypothetical protein [Aerococcaceae bacterium zg-BR9]
MKEILELPEDAQTLYRLGMKKLLEGKEDEALEHLQRSLEIEWQDEVFEEIIQVNMILLRLTLVKELWETNFARVEDLITRPALIPLYVQCLPILMPFKQRLMTLNELKSAMQKQSWDTTVLEEQLESVKELVSLQTQIEIATEQDSLEQWVEDNFDIPPFEQLLKVKPLYEIDSSVVRPVFELILQSDDFYNYIKNDILHHLIIHKASGTVEYSWFGEHEILDLEQLSVANDHPLIQEVIQKLLDYVEKENPHMEGMIMDYFYAMAMIIYPHYDEIDLTADQWVKEILLLLGLEGDPFRDEVMINDIFATAQFEYLDIMDDDIFI